MQAHGKNCDYFEPWLQYQQPEVRQLAFALASPNILAEIPQELVLLVPFHLHDDHFWQRHYAHYIPRLRELDQNPQELLDFLQQIKSTRLGLRFEALIWFWLQDSHYHPYQLLGHSIQQIAGSKTLGELDFLLLNTETQQIEHWEVALKYYLGERQLALPDWFGLNRSDTLQRKLKHFTEKQFQFSQALGYDIAQRFTVLKGQLYLPHCKLQPPQWVNTARRLGSWSTHIPRHQHYRRLLRAEWLCPHTINNHVPASHWWTDGLYLSLAEEPEYFMFRSSLAPWQTQKPKLQPVLWHTQS